MLNRTWFGEGDRTPIVLLHEGLGSVKGWSTFPQDLAKATERRVLAYDRLGYGESPNKPEPWNPDFMNEGAIELAELMKEEGLDRAILVGHSDGASISLLYAKHTAGLAKRATIEAIVSLSGHVFVEQKTVDEIQLVRQRFADSLRRPLARQHDHVDNMFSAWSSVWVSDRFRRWNIEADLAEVTCPVLIVQGCDDSFGSWEQVERLEGALGGPSRVLPLPGVNHWPHREATEEVLTSIRDFLYTD